MSSPDVLDPEAFSSDSDLAGTKQEIDRVFAEITGAIDPDRLAIAEELASDSRFVLEIGAHLRNIRYNTAGFDTPGTSQLPIGFDRAMRGGQ